MKYLHFVHHSRGTEYIQTESATDNKINVKQIEKLHVQLEKMKVSFSVQKSYFFVGHYPSYIHTLVSETSDIARNRRNQVGYAED